MSVLKRFEVNKIDHLDQGQDELDDDLQTEICRCKDCLNSEYCSPDHEKGRIEDRKSRVLAQSIKDCPIALLKLFSAPLFVAPRVVNKYV
jgi:CDGSH-type Zn-finger protein